MKRDRIILAAGEVRMQTGTVLPWEGTATALAERFAALRGLPPHSKRKLEVRLERPIVQIRELPGLPRVSQRDLKALVSHQASRFFRSGGRSLSTDAVWRRGGMAEGQMVAVAAAADPELLKAIEESSARLGWRLEAIGVESPGAAPRLRLASPVGLSELRRKRRKRLVRGAFALTSVLVLLSLGLVAALVIQNRRLDARLSDIRRPAAAVAGLRRSLNDASLMIDAIQEFRSNRGQVLVPLANVTASLPDSAVLTSFTADLDGTGRITGHAQRALEVLSSLEHSGIGRVVLEGRLGRETVSGRNWERFTIRFERSP